MKNITTSAAAGFRLWILTAVVAAPFIAYTLGDENLSAFFLMIPPSLSVALIGSIPAFFSLLVLLPLINSRRKSICIKLFWLLTLIIFISVLYGILAGSIGLGMFFLHNPVLSPFVANLLVVSCTLIFSSISAALILLKYLVCFFSSGVLNPASYTEAFSIIFFKSNKTIIMEHTSREAQSPAPVQSHRVLIKGFITGGLILLMLIPTIFIQNLITEREARQKEVVQEVSSRWATSQTLTGPFLTVPYTESYVNAENKVVTTKTQLIIPSDKLAVTGTVIPEERSRSIYKVLLYKARVNFSGNFKPIWPADINIANIDLTNAKLCFSLSDYKGIEEEVAVNFDNRSLLLTPGLPIDALGETGLSVPVSLSADSLNAGIPFSMQIKIKGSEQLQFIPLSINSKFRLESKWPSPSFDGNILPDERNVSDSGFNAQWSFNRANLSFGTVVKAGEFKPGNIAFGVSLVQPADQYNKTMRSVKYAILLIGLTFALFFIIELMQKRPFHPVQYVLVGVALVIFYTLLLSISEYLSFDMAYLIAASATVLLITLYAKSHFESWKSAGVLGTLLSCLYGFIFILIRLEDTALIVGSIGLFVILALVMFASRKINWYGNQPQHA